MRATAHDRHFCRCLCGRRHGDASSLTKLGWQEVGGGEFTLLAACPCGSTLAVSVLKDASKCDACKRIVTGTEGDVKVCLEHDHRALVLCAACFRRRDPRARRR
jgi:hypothetical protein